MKRAHRYDVNGFGRRKLPSRRLIVIHCSQRGTDGVVIG